MLDIEIEPRATSLHLQTAALRKDERRFAAQKGLGDRLTIIDSCRLHQEDGAIIELAIGLAEESPPNVILDVSAMPKRFFFPILTHLCEASQIENLVVTNTSPLRYGDVMSGGWDDWKPLPIYDGDPFDHSPNVTLVVGVGYQLLSIQQILERNKSRTAAVKLMLPFPSLHPGLIENWKFIRHIVRQRQASLEGRQSERPPIERVPISDVSLAFDRLVRLTERGKTRSLILAPYGPKPLSVAMCLLGFARRTLGFDDELERWRYPTEIGYTQPAWYHPDYTAGIRLTNGVPDVAAFCIRLKGRSLYQLD
ncbi:MAG: hypothetical protein R3C59_03920 [Planctomycetaceae bacterium]